MISVLTLVKDRELHLLQLVEGLRRSERTPSELVIVDMSRQPIAAVDIDIPLKIARLETDALPLAQARNVAAQMSTGEYFLFLDVDCIPRSGLVGTMMEALETNDALICADVSYLGPNDARGSWSEAELLGRGKAHSVRSFPQSGLRAENDPALFWSLAFGISRRRFDELGGFDETFVGYGAEDTDFGFRARQIGLPLMFLGGTGVFHQYHPVSDPPVEHLESIVRNAMVFYERWRVWPMSGWLDAFEEAGLIRRNQDRIDIV